jgi:hypothetical protein
VAARLTGRAGPARPRLVVLAILAASLVAGGCAVDGPAVTFPPQSFGTGSTTGAAAATAGAVTRALGAVSVQVREPQTPYRPPESPTLAGAPRTVLQAVLPDEPGHGYISIYEFSDAAAATAAGREMAEYVASGPGRVQFVPDTRFVLRHVGPTVVFYHWSPANSTDDQAASVQAALETVGEEIEVIV